MLPADPSVFFAQFDTACSMEQAVRDAALQEAADAEAALAEELAHTPIALSLPEGETWYMLRSPEPEAFTRWQTSLKKEGATPRTWSLLLAAYDAGWTLTSKKGTPLPSPAEMKSLQSWNRVPRPAVEALIEWVAREASGVLATHAE